MKRRTTFIYTLFALLIGLTTLVGSRNSPPNGRTGAPGDGLCSDAGCHNPQNMNTSGTVTISGLPSTIDAGQTYTITVNSTVTSGTAPVAGFEIVALNSSNQNAGSMSNAGSGATISTSGGRTYCKHNGGPKNTPASWNFDWTAPSGPDGEVITMYAASNLANDNGNNSGDRIVTTNTSGTLMSTAPPLSVDVAIINNVSCAGGSDGQATANVSGGTPPYSYQWSNGSSGSTASNLSAGPISVTVTDSGNQSENASNTITEPQPLNLTLISKTEIDCNGNSSGSANVLATGGTQPYLYNWSNGQTGPDLVNVPAGTYTVTVTDANSCENSLSVTFEDPELLTTSINNVTDATCHDSNDGSGSITIAGGTQPYNIAWPDGQNTIMANNLSAGDYDVTVTDANNCQSVITVTIGSPPELILELVSSSPESCIDAEDGTAEVDAFGGTPPYTYSWADGSSGNTNNSLSEGTITATVTDANDCEATLDITITQEDDEAPIMSVNDVTVYLDDIGQAEIDASSVDAGTTDNCGLDTLTLDQSLFDCSNIGDDNPVTLTAVDLSGNEASEMANVTVIDSIFPMIECPADMTINTCTDTVFYDDPMVSDNCLAGPPVLTNGLGSGSVFPSGETVETYEVTDLGGNSSMCSFTITVEDNLAITTSSMPASCFESSDGTASVDSITGGTPPFSITWENGSNDSLISGLGIGTYSVTVADDAGCFRIGQVSVDGPDSLYIQVDSTNNTTGGMANGAIFSSGQGGTPPYTVEWSGPNGFMSSEFDLTDLEPGTYTATITDANGCTGAGATVEIESSTSVDEQNPLASIKVFPNPGRGLITIQVPTQQARDMVVSLFDLTGKEVFYSGNKDMVNSGENWDFTDQPAGIYYLVIRSGEFQKVEKIVITP